MKTPARLRKGSAIGITMMVALFLTVLGGSVLYLTTTVRKVTDSHYTYHALLPVAERGIDQAMSLFNKYVDDNSQERTQPMLGHDTTANWDTDPTWKGSVADGYARDFGQLDLGDGHKVALKVIVKNIPTETPPSDPKKLYPYAVAEVTFLPGAYANSQAYTRQFVASLAVNTSLGNGLIALNSLTLNGNKVYVDSYDSNKGAYNSLTNRSDLVTVASPSIIDNAVSLGNADIYGFVATGDKPDGTNPAVSFQNAHVYGHDSDSKYKTSGIDPLRLKQDYVPPADSFKPDVTPSLTSGTVPQTVTTYNPDGTVAGTSTNLVVPNRTTLNNWTTNSNATLSSGVYFLSATNSTLSGLTGNELIIDGDVVIYVTDASQTVCATNTAPSNFPTIKVGGTGQISVLPPSKSSTGRQSTLKIFTPGNVDISGGGIVNPTIVPENLYISGVNSFVGAKNKIQSISLSGNNGFSGVLYAPTSSITLGGGGNADTTFLGSVVALMSSLGGNITFHFDVQLNQKTKPQYYLNTFTELTGKNKISM